MAARTLARVTVPAGPGRPAAYVAGLPTPERCLVMGVVNVTPTPSPMEVGGSSLDDAVTQGLRLAAQGPTWSTWGRVHPARRPASHRGGGTAPGAAGRPRSGRRRSRRLDRHHARRRRSPSPRPRRDLVDDVSGGQADPGMLRVVADAGVPVVLMHWRGAWPACVRRSTATWWTTSGANCYHRLDEAVEAGISRSHRARSRPRFAKTATTTGPAHSSARDRRPRKYPVLSLRLARRSSERLLADPTTGEDRSPDGRDAATAVLSALIAWPVPGACGCTRFRPRWTPSSWRHAGRRGPRRATWRRPRLLLADVLAANAAFCEAVERGDIDALEAYGSTARPSASTGGWRRSTATRPSCARGPPYCATPYLVRPHRRDRRGARRRGRRHLLENLLSAADSMPDTVFAGGHAVAQCVPARR